MKLHVFLITENPALCIDNDVGVKTSQYAEKLPVKSDAEAVPGPCG